MEKELFTIADLNRIYRIQERYKTLKTLYHAEERGEIPTAERSTRGKLQVRTWHLKQLPEIGKRFGFLPSPHKQFIITNYIKKGGVGKSTITYNLARALALNGIKTLLIGLDDQCSITNAVFPKKDIQSLDEIETYRGLYDFFVNKNKIEDIIYKTSLPTLDIIPESHHLEILEQWFEHQTRLEDVFKDELIPHLKAYEVIIFDTPTAWSPLVKNAITAANILIAPLACEAFAYAAYETNINRIFDFQKKMKLEQKVIMIANLLQSTSVSQQIYGQYLNKQKDYIIPIPINGTVKIQEALIQKQSMLEYMPTSSISKKYYEVIKHIWWRITDDNSIQLCNLNEIEA